MKSLISNTPKMLANIPRIKFIPNLLNKNSLIAVIDCTA